MAQIPSLPPPSGWPAEMGEEGGGADWWAGVMLVWGAGPLDTSQGADRPLINGMD